MPQRVFTRFAEIAGTLRPREAVRTIFEVGARDCEESKAFAAAYPQARVFAFECNPATLPLCRAAAAGEPRITLIEKAASNREGPTVFFPVDPDRTATGLADGNPGASSLFEASGDYPLETYVQRRIEVQTTTLAAVMRERSIESIDLLWMDVQGAELLVLEGLGERIRDVAMIHTEVEFFEIYKGQALFADVDRFLTGAGFALAGFTSYSQFAADAVYYRPADTRGIALGALRARFGYLQRNLRHLRRHRFKRALRRWVGLPEWPGSGTR